MGCFSRSDGFAPVIFLGWAACLYTEILSETGHCEPADLLDFRDVLIVCGIQLITGRAISPRTVAEAKAPTT
jgi:hypothetical protein